MVASTAPAAGDRQLPAVHFRGGLFTVMVLRLGDPKDQTFYTAVMEKIAQSPDFFRHAPVVLDLRELADAPPFNIAEVVRRLRQHQVVPIGVQNGTEEQNRTAVNAGLSVLPEGHAPKPRAETPTAGASERKAAGAAPPAEGVPSHTLVVNRPVRSGRQVYAQRGDLIVLAAISAGAELLADGHIHVYGALRGRAHAGVAGDAQARIFCRSLEAELVSIAGCWRVRDDMPDNLIGKPVQMYLDGEKLVIEPLA